MANSVRYQVFVSSTFTDLVEERAEVIQALWELDCIPTGMEAFVASNESQWNVIKRVIDECDYYVLIIGGRYGSITDEGMSYTEKEYRYAKQIGLPILAFVHGDPESITVGKSEKSTELQEKLENLRKEVMAEYPIRTWSNPSELGALVSRSLIREVKLNPRIGWVRNDGTSPEALLEQVSTLTQDNQRLQETVKELQEDSGETDLESGDDQFEIWGTRDEGNSYYSTEQADWNALVSWDDMFRDIAPSLINEATEHQLRSRLSTFHVWDEAEAAHVVRPKIAVEAWDAIIVQFRALGLVDQGMKKRGVNDSNSYWRLTPKGDRHLVNLLARRKKTEAK